MTEQEIVEGNKLIEKFNTGRELMPNGLEFGRKRGMPKEHENWYDVVGMEEIRYDKKWELLMPVLTKIIETKYDDGDTAYCRTFGMINPPDNKMMVRLNRQPVFEADTLIEATWLAVVDFIKD